MIGTAMQGIRAVVLLGVVGVLATAASAGPRLAVVHEDRSPQGPAALVVSKGGHLIMALCQKGVA